jgi:GMP synthase (glutamine-hydrolysing)
MGLERSDYLRQQYDCYSSHVVQACDHKSWKLIRSYKLMKYGSQHKIIGGILVEKEMIIVLDFGGQYNQLIARRVRECNVYCEVHPYTLPLEKIKEMNPKGIIFTGGPNSVYKEESPRCSKEIFDLGIPVLGICYGAQLMSYLLGGEVATAPVSEYGKTEVEVDTTSKLYEGVSPKTICWMSHTDYISKMPEGFRVTAHTPVCPIAGMENEEKGWYGIQAHPEVLHTQEGSKMLHNFVYSVCHCAGDWKMDAFVEKSIEEIRKKVGNGRALLALSGGVDSSVAGVLMAKAIGDQLTCVFVDHGLLRKNEGDEVEAVFGPNGPYKLNFIRVNAQQRFYDKLAGVTDPERKRKIIGEEFIRVFEEEAKKIGKVDYFVQGTIYPDVIESGLGKSAVIKSHHNVGGLPEHVDFKEIIEPLRMLFKDEVRRAGLELGIPENLVYRQPFPVIALAAADLTRHIDIRQEMHLDLDDAVAGARLTAPAFFIEAETSFIVAFCLGIRRCRKQIPDQIKCPRIGCRIGTRRPPDRRLVDRDNLIELLDALDGFMFSRNRVCSVQLLCQRFIKNLIDK